MPISADAGMTVRCRKHHEVVGRDRREATEKLVVDVCSRRARHDEDRGAYLFIDRSVAIDGDEVSDARLYAVLREADRDRILRSGASIDDVDETSHVRKVVAVYLTDADYR